MKPSTPNTSYIGIRWRKELAREFFSGKNVRWLVRKYGFSMRMVEQIIREAIRK